MQTRPLRQSTIALLSATLLLGCSRPSPTGVALDRSIREPSGLTASPHDPAVFWTHADSGHDNVLFAVDASGKLLATAEVVGIDNVDWEDITHDDAGNLWLGDIGNNLSSRKNLAVYRIPEPASLTGVTQLHADLTVPFHYPEQHGFGDSALNFDAESLFWWQGSLWLLTKHRSDDLTRLYRFPQLDGSEVALEQVASFDLGPNVQPPRKDWSGMVTAAEVASDGKHWAMLSYDGVYVFATPGSGQGAELFGQQVAFIGFDMDVMRQVEALAWDGAALLIVNEDRAVFRIEDPLTRSKYP